MVFRLLGEETLVSIFSFLQDIIEIKKKQIVITLNLFIFIKNNFFDMMMF